MNFPPERCESCGKTSSSYFVTQRIHLGVQRGRVVTCTVGCLLKWHTNFAWRALSKIGNSLKKAMDNDKPIC